MNDTTLAAHLGLNLDTYTWHNEAVCATVDPALFWPEGYGNHREQEATAKAICRTCPVLDKCRDHALNHPEEYGTWGGLTEYERRHYRRQNKAAA